MTVNWMTPPPRMSMPPTPLQIKTPGTSSDIPPLDIAHLWEKANKALGDWLAIKSFVDAC